MRRIAISIFLFFLLVGNAVSAADNLSNAFKTDGSSPLKNTAEGSGYKSITAGTNDVYGTIGKVINVFLSLLGVIFLLLSIYAGYLWMTAQGDEKQVEKAQSIIKAAIMGLIVIIAAYALSAFVITKFTATTLQ